MFNNLRREYEAMLSTDRDGAPPMVPPRERPVTPPTLERLVPDEAKPGEITGAQTLALHVRRYQFASEFVRGTRLLDIACGSGYGTALLAEAHPEVRCAGVDISTEAVEYARTRYAKDNTTFIVKDAMTFLDDDGFDTIVSLETIEHMRRPGMLVAQLVWMLRLGGRLIASVPITPMVDADPYHYHDFTAKSFRDLFQGPGYYGLREIGHLEQVQPYNPVAVLQRKEARMQGMRGNLLGYYASHPTSLAKRVGSTIRHGFRNKYLVIAWERVE